MTTSTPIGYVSDLARLYLGHPAQVCVITFKDDRTHLNVLDVCIRYRITFEVLEENQDTDTVVPRTILIHPDNLERVLLLSGLKNDKVEIRYQ